MAGEMQLRESVSNDDVDDSGPYPVSRHKLLWSHQRRRNDNASIINEPFFEWHVPRDRSLLAEIFPQAGHEQ